MTKLEKVDSRYGTRYDLRYTIKVNQPPYNNLTINEFKLDAFECGKVKQNQNFLPTPKAYSKRALRINNEIYDIKQVSLHNIHEQVYSYISLILSSYIFYYLGISHGLKMESLS